MSRLYVVEATHSITGGSADHRLTLPMSRIDGYTRALARELGVPGISASAVDGVPAQWVAEVAADLRSAGRQAAVVIGRNQPAHVHALGLAINTKVYLNGHLCLSHHRRRWRRSSSIVGKRLSLHQRARACCTSSTCHCERRQLQHR